MRLLLMYHFVRCTLCYSTLRIPDLRRAANASGISTTTSLTTDSCVDEYGDHCGAIVFAQGFNFWPTTYTHLAATKYLVVNNNSTSTSVRYNTENFTVPATDYDSYSIYGTFQNTVNELAITTFGTTLYWPTNYLAVATDISLTRAYETIDSLGRTYCVHTTFLTDVPKAIQTPGWQFVIPVPDDFATAGGGDDTEAQLSPKQMAEMGLNPAWNCSGGGTGIPVANIPVLYLTTTSTVVQSQTAATPAEPASSIPSVSQTSKPSATVIPQQSTESTDNSASYTASIASLNSISSTAIATPSGGASIPAPVTQASPIPTPVPITTLGSIPIKSSGPNVIVGIETLLPGSVITISGTPLSLAPSNSIIVIAPSSAYYPPAPEVTENSQSEYLIRSQTLSPGGPAITAAGKTISLASFATELVVGTSTIALNPGPELGTVTIPLAHITEAPSAPAITFGGAVITPNAQSGYVIDGQTLVPGGPALTISGTVVSLAPSGTALMLGSSTIPLSPVPISPAGPVITLNGETLTPNAQSAYIIASQTLIPGGPALTISGTIVSLAPSGTALVFGSSTIPLPPISTSPNLPILTLGRSTLTANSQSDFVIGTQTLIPGGPAVTISGEVLSLAPSATALVVVSSPESAVTSSMLGLGGIILSALGGGGGSLTSMSRTDVSGTTATATASATDGAVPFAGKAPRREGKLWWSCLGFGLCAGLHVFT